MILFLKVSDFINSHHCHILQRRCHFNSQDKHDKGYNWDDFELNLGKFPPMLVLPRWWSSSLAALHSPPLVNGAAHHTVSGSTMNPPVSSRPFRLESLDVPVSSGKVKRKKTKSHMHNEGIWKDFEFPTYLNTYYCHLCLWLITYSLQQILNIESLITTANQKCRSCVLKLILNVFWTKCYLRYDTFLEFLHCTKRLLIHALWDSKSSYYNI